VDNEIKKKKILFRLFSYILPYKFHIFAAFVSSIVVAAASASPAYIVEKLLNNVLLEKNEFYLKAVTIALPFLLLIKGIFFFFQNYVMAYVGQKMIIGIRYDVFAHLQKVSLSFFSKKSTGHIISRLTNDVNVLQFMVHGSMNIIVDIITVIMLVSYLFYLHWKLTLLVFIVLPLIGGIVAKFSSKLRRAGHNIQSKVADVTSILHEAISGVHITRAFTMEEKEIQKFHEKDKETMKANLKGVKLQNTVVPLVELMNTIGIAIVMYYGGLIVISGELTTGELIGFLAACGMTFTPIKKLTSVNSVFQQSISAAERVFDIMGEEPEEHNNQDMIVLDKVEGKVDFENVSFSYDGKTEVISGLELHTNPGEIVALVGPSGAGKSTLVSLIPRFYAVNSGRILIDGYDINNLNIRSIRKHIAVVPQDTILFSGTIAENIAYGRPDASMEDIIEAAKMANAHRFITEFKEGYNTLAGERGTLLSGGQRQRIAIARALLRDAKILILDEATSALDSESESLVQEALEKLMKNRTTFVIAHRLSTIRKADKICVIDNGKVVQIGTHSELLEKGGEYRQIYNAQFYFLEENEKSVEV